MDYWCVGNLKLTTSNKYSWYLSDNNLTYCQWCWENKCFNVEKAIIIRDDKPIRSKCYCTQNHKKLDTIVKSGLEKLICPNCWFNNINGNKFEDPLKCLNEQSVESNTRCYSCGIEKDKDTHNVQYQYQYQYCNICCFLNSICIICNERIKNGNQYFNEFWESFSPEYPNLSYDAYTGLPLYVLYRLKGTDTGEVIDGIITGSLYEMPESRKKKEKRFALEEKARIDLLLKKKENEKENEKANIEQNKEQGKEEIGEGTEETIVQSKEKLDQNNKTGPGLISLNYWWNNSKNYMFKLVNFNNKKMKK